MSDLIIVGVTCDVKQEELAAHCRARAAVHAEKATRYKARLAELLEKSKEHVLSGETEAVVQRKMSGYSNNPFENDISEAQAKAQRHEERHKTFTFWAEHLPAGATFRLSMSDLGTLELTSR